MAAGSIKTGRFPLSNISGSRSRCNKMADNVAILSFQHCRISPAVRTAESEVSKPVIERNLNTGKDCEHGSVEMKKRVVAISVKMAGSAASHKSG